MIGFNNNIGNNSDDKIPLTGTVGDKPISGDLQFAQEYTIAGQEIEEGVFDEDQIGVVYGRIIAVPEIDSVGFGTKSVYNGDSYFKIVSEEGFWQRHKMLTGQMVTNGFYLAGQELLISSDDPDFRGLGAFKYYGEYYMPNNYVQLRYITENTQMKSKQIEASGAIDNIVSWNGHLIFFTAATTITLPTNLPDSFSFNFIIEDGASLSIVKNENNYLQLSTKFPSPMIGSTSASFGTFVRKQNTNKIYIGY